MYFVWYDDNPQKAVATKIDEAVGRFKKHYGSNPKICMLNEAVAVADYEVAGLQLMSTKNVPQNYFWVGNEV